MCDVPYTYSQFATVVVGAAHVDRDGRGDMGSSRAMWRARVSERQEGRESTQESRGEGKNALLMMLCN